MNYSTNIMLTASEIAQFVLTQKSVTSCCCCYTWKDTIFAAVTICNHILVVYQQYPTTYFKLHSIVIKKILTISKLNNI